jgi:hypothetical protein
VSVISSEGGINEVDPDTDYVLYQTLFAYRCNDPEDLSFEANEILQVGRGGPCRLSLHCPFFSCPFLFSSAFCLLLPPLPAPALDPTHILLFRR